MSRKPVRFIQFILAMSILIAANSLAIEEPPRSGVVEFGTPDALAVAPGPAGVGANVNTTTNPNPQNETSIAADPGNPGNLVGGTNDYRDGDSDAGVAVSFDGGATWAASTLNLLNPILGKYDGQGDPAIAAYRKGVFYYAFIDFSRTTPENRLGVAKSFDGGVAWPQLGVIIDHMGPGDHDFEDKEYIAVDNTGSSFDGNVYVSWTRFPVAVPNRIMFSRSVDGGVTFSVPMQISDSTGGYQGSVPAVGPRGELYVTWWRSNNRIEIDKSTDGGLTWGRDILVANIDTIPSPLPGAAFRDNSFPTIGVDTSGGPNNGYVYIAWADEGGGNGNDGTPNIMCTRSTDGGVTWDTPIIVSDDTNREFQWFPWMSVDSRGNVDIAFYDRRDAPVSRFFHTYCARSTDGGLSFGSNVRVSDEISDSALDGFGGAFIGDYNGLVTTSKATYPYWTDIRASNGKNGNAEGYTAAKTFDDEPVNIHITGVPNPAVIGRPFMVLLDLKNPGPAFTGTVALYGLVNGNLILIKKLTGLPIPAGFNLTGFPYFTTSSFPSLPSPIGLLGAIFNDATGALLAHDVDVIGVTTAPTASGAAEIDRQAAEFIKTLTLAKLNRTTATPLGIAASPQVASAAPNENRLGPAYPTPANPETWIPYQLSQSAEVKIKIYSASGKLVRALDLGQREPGYYHSKEEAAYWNGRSQTGEQVSSGIYFYTLEAGNFVSTRKLVILK